MRKGRFVVLVAGEATSARLTFRLAGEALALARVESVAEAAIKLHFYAPAVDRPGAADDSGHKAPALCYVFVFCRAVTCTGSRHA